MDVSASRASPPLLISIRILLSITATVVLCHAIPRQRDYLPLLSSSSSSSSSSSGGMSCDREIGSSRHKSGVISSPSFPRPYPTGIVCRFRFQGDSRERIQLVFTTVELSYMTGDASEPQGCEKVDTVTVSTMEHPQKKYSVIGTYCGSKIPPRLMSSTNKMLVTFASRSESGSTGFQANYSFVTDYGITTGVQDHTVDCRFIFRSDRSPNGSFTSPNYPGLYPRNTVCQYRFYGRPHEQIVITFRYFDVEGIPPKCSNTTQSDYLEITDDISVVTSRHGDSRDVSFDSEKSRYCVAKDERSKKSFSFDSHFLQITFNSNDVYDAFGFDALYQFRTQRVDSMMLSSSASVHPIRSASLLLQLLLLCLTVMLVAPEAVTMRDATASSSAFV